MFIWFVLMALIVFADQLTKYFTVLYLKPVDTYPIIQDFLHLTYVENRGAAFGMLADNRWVFMSISTVAILLLGVYLVWKKPESKLECLSLAFIIGGGIGNMIDRVALGYVVDMIDFRVIRFAVFNVADSFVCVGAGLLMLSLLISACKEIRAGRAVKAQNDKIADPLSDPATPQETDGTTEAETGEAANGTEIAGKPDMPDMPETLETEQDTEEINEHTSDL